MPGSLPPTLRSTDALLEAGLVPANSAALRQLESRYAIGVPEAFRALIQAPGDPIARQVIPDVAEFGTALHEVSDPTADAAHSPLPGLVHRYPDRVLFLVTDRCASYCRYCTRSRVVSGAGAWPRGGTTTSGRAGRLGAPPGNP